MKPNAPWSVKGIERDARETAKEAARREGMTVGEWLSQVIQTAGDPASSDGDIVGLKTADIVTAIEFLNRRVHNAETKNAAAMAQMAQSLSQLAARLHRAPVGAESISGSSLPGDLGARVAALEAKTSDRTRIEQLKALERAVAQVAVQFDAAQRALRDRQTEADTRLNEAIKRFETTFSKENAMSAVAGVRDAVDALSARLVRAEKIASEAARLNAESARAIDPQFVEQTGNRLRVLGDEIKRGGDQIRALETSIRRMSEQIDAAEKRSAEGVQKVADTIADLRGQFEQSETPSATRADIDAAIDSVTRRTEERMARLQRSFDDMISRLDTAEAGRPSASALMPGAAGLLTVMPARAEFDSEPAPIATLRDEPESDADFRFDLDLDDEPAAEPVVIAAPLRTALPAESAEGDEDLFVAEEAPDALEDAIRTFGSFDRPRSADSDDMADDDFGDDEDDAEEPLVAAPQPAADFIKRARLQARETAEQRARETTDLGKNKRSLSPKQKAILAARARQKKLAEQGLYVEQGREAVEPLPLPAGAVVSAQPASRDAHGSKAEAPAAEKRGSALRAAARRVTTPLGLEKVVAQATARPVYTAIGVATAVLVGAAVVGLGGDRQHAHQRKPSPRGVPVRGAAVNTPTTARDSVVAPSPGQSSAPTAASDQAPTIDPRALYFDSVSKLKAATTDAARQSALDELKQAATLGHAPAQLQLGEVYKLGQDAKQDLALARLWYTRAANGGNVLAMHRVGVMLARGQGGGVDAAGAIAWFERAANLGLLDSQYNLGAIYHPGGEQATTLQDAAKAYYWYALAAKNGDAQAAQSAAGLGAALKPEERKKADAAVAAWKPTPPDAAANELAPDA